MLYDDYLYGRISEDEIGKERGVSRQLRNCRDFSVLKSGQVIAEFSDNDVSALKGAPRSGYDRLMAAITAPNPERRPRRIITQHTSRLWRNRSERAAGIDTLGRAKVIVLPIDGPELDLRSAAGRMVAGMLGEVDTGESETKAERIVDAARERAYEGRTNGAVLYGWKRVYQYDRAGRVVGFDDVIDEAEAGVVREIVGRLLSGESLAGVTADLNARGVPAPRAGDRRRKRALGQTEDGALWGKTSVKKIAVRPANIGLRIYHRGCEDEELLPAAWPALIDPLDYERVTALLAANQGPRVERPGARLHLLTWGIGACGVCGMHLRVATKGNARWGKMSKLYVCEARGCVGRNVTSVDGYVTAVMVRLLSRPDAADLLDGDAGVAVEAAKRAAAIRARLDRAASDYADGVIDSTQLRIISGRLKPEIAAAEAEAAAHRTNPFAALASAVIGDQAEERWGAMSVTQRRAVMNAFGMRVFVDPVTRKGPGFDPSSVRIEPEGGWPMG